jgi:hypothetical protein
VGRDGQEKAGNARRPGRSRFLAYPPCAPGPVEMRAKRYDRFMPKQQSWLARRVGVAVAVIVMAYLVVGLSVSTSGILQPTSPADRAAAR